MLLFLFVFVCFLGKSDGLMLLQDDLSVWYEAHQRKLWYNKPKPAEAKTSGAVQLQIYNRSLFSGQQFGKASHDYVRLDICMCSR